MVEKISAKTEKKGGIIDGEGRSRELRQAKAHVEIEKKEAQKEALKKEAKHEAPKEALKKSDEKTGKLLHSQVHAGKKDEKSNPAAKSSKKKSEKKPKVEFEQKEDDVKKLVELIKLKRNNHPVFRGRFGKRTIRSRHIEKWNKWRKPRGIDLRHEKEDGLWPDTGYRSAHSIRFLHPSGYSERMVKNVKEVELLSKEKGIVLRIASAVGEKKRKEILHKAHSFKLRVLN